MKSYLRLMRIRHWVKNVLVFVPLLFSGLLFDFQKSFRTFFGGVSFCFISSAVYILNDIKDFEKDRVHPRKCNRPIASGEISKRKAIILTLFCIAAAIIFQIFSGNIQAGIYLLLYFILNVFYSFGLKDRPMIDIIILVSGFLIRILYGADMADISISAWLYLTVISGSFYMGLGKRRNEYETTEYEKSRHVLQYYNYKFLDKNMYMCLGLANAFYSLWAMDSGNRYILWTVPVVLLISMKYSLVVEGDSDGDPVEVILHDKLILFLVCTYAVFILFALYYK